MSNPCPKLGLRRRHPAQSVVSGRGLPGEGASSTHRINLHRPSFVAALGRTAHAFALGRQPTTLRPHGEEHRIEMDLYWFEKATMPVTQLHCSQHPGGRNFRSSTIKEDKLPAYCLHSYNMVVFELLSFQSNVFQEARVACSF